MTVRWGWKGDIVEKAGTLDLTLRGSDPIPLPMPSFADAKNLVDALERHTELSEHYARESALWEIEQKARQLRGN